ncbi:MAG: hypothetical protein IPL90_09535 [Holophagales bacterium]|nr:hypothetical protein [Holophagales bacterium]
MKIPRLALAALAAATALALAAPAPAQKPEAPKIGAVAPTSPFPPRPAERPWR